MTEQKNEQVGEPEFIEGLDYYFEDGLMVLTDRFLLNRGYCCKNGCRHCPYSDEDDQSKNSSNSL